jgi:hypothetical protein
VGTASATFSARHAWVRAVIRSALESHFGLDNPDGSRSSLRQVTVQVGDKVYSIPTVRSGQILEGPDAIKAVGAEGWDKFPSYANHDEGEALRPDARLMDKDARSRSAQARASSRSR